MKGGGGREKGERMKEGGGEGKGGEDGGWSLHGYH